MEGVLKNKTNKIGKKEMSLFLLGASLLSTGGGGPIEFGEEILKSIENINIIDSVFLNDNDIGISTAVLGGGVSKQEVVNLLSISKTPISYKLALEYQELVGEKISFVFAPEIGPQNTMEGMQLASFLNVPFVDADTVGRAVPEMYQTTLSIKNIKMTPFALASFYGDIVLVKKTQNFKRNEEIARAFANISNNLLCFVGFKIKGKIFRDICVRNTITKCINLGRFLCDKSLNEKQIAKKINGKIVFEGSVNKIMMEKKNSFFYGNLFINGEKEYKYSKYKIWFKNEFLISWINDEVDITCPDLICVMDTKTRNGKVTYGPGFRNSLNVGDKVTVFGIPSDQIWKTKKGLEILSPCSFGYDFKYKEFKY